MFGGASPSTENKEQHEVFTKATASNSITQRIKKNKNNNNNSRRFSDEQIKSLESLFKTENKLEPRKKLEMARELGLHPRQVAIWFQNRRARWKSKQMEQDYSALRADYDTLSDRFQSLKKEKHALLKQLRNLCSQVKEPHESGSKFDLDSGSEENENEGEINGNSSGFSEPLEQQDMQAAAIYYTDEDDPIKHNDVQNQQEELDENVKMQGGDYTVSKEEEEITHEKVTNFGLGSLFDQSCAGTYSSNWWDVWSTIDPPYGGEKL